MMRKLVFSLVTVVLLLSNSEAWGVEMRRPLGPTQPMWLIHVDNSYGEDAQQCIDAVPQDVLPYVVFNLAVTNSDNYQKIEEWLSVCQQNHVWAMVQCSSGIRNSMSDTDITPYEHLYRTYSSLIGFNFCEQDWGFDTDTFKNRLELFCQLMELGRKYGGYLYVNDMQSVSNATWNTIAKMKAWNRFSMCSKVYANHLIYGDKTTMSCGYYDNESACLGMYLSGHSGYYAIRFDQYAWSYSGHGPVFGTESNDVIPNSLAWFSCPEALMGTSIVEHLMMQGACVIDGPEIPIITCLYGGRQTPTFKNVICDIMRKVIDGTITIPTHDEVLARTQMAFVVNYYTVSDDTPLYEGLYQMDGNHKANRTWLKKSGRYGSIPTVATEEDAQTISTNYVTAANYTSRWATIDAKMTEMNGYYPEVSTGDMYVGRVGNSLYAYNPYINTDQNAAADIPLNYNSCTSLSLDYTPHTFSVINETESGISIHLNNYRTDKSALWEQYPSMEDGDGKPRMYQSTVQTYMKNTFIDNPTHNTLRTNTIKVAGCTAKPTYTWSERGDHAASSVTDSYADGTLTLTILHNGPIDLQISCKGSDSGTSAPARQMPKTINRPTSKIVENDEAFVYDFEQYGEEATYATNAGTAKIVTVNGSKALNPVTQGAGTNKVAAVTLGQFGTESDYSVTWKEYTTAGTKGGFLLRGTYDKTPTANPCVLSGYYFQTQTSLSSGTTAMSIRKYVNNEDGTATIGNKSVSVSAPNNGIRWYRASANGETLTFYYSDDGENFTEAVTLTDNTYSSGITQLLWGLDGGYKTTFYDDIMLTADKVVSPEEPEIPSCVDISIPTTGYTTFSSTYPLDFSASGVAAYIATSTSSDVVYLKQVTTTPANTGVLLKGTAGSYTASTTEEADALSDTNLLQATSEAAYTVSSFDADYIYVLARQDGVIGFYPASTGVTIPTGYSYLRLPMANARAVLRFDTSTGIEHLRMEGQSSSSIVYDLSGRKVQNVNLSRGLYIVHGKKVIVK